MSVLICAALLAWAGRWDDFRSVLLAVVMYPSGRAAGQMAKKATETKPSGQVK